jgi:hypothetical protein
MEDLQQLTTVSRDLPVPDTRDLPVSCTTTEGVQNNTNAISGYRTQSLLHLLSCRHIHIRQRGNRYPHATTRFTHTTTLRTPPQPHDQASTWPTFNKYTPLHTGNYNFIPHTSILLTAFVFNDDDLHSNLFGVSPLTEHGLSATYTNDDLQITTPTPYGPKTILYGAKQPGDNVWRFSLPKSRSAAVHNVIRHEQHAELALYASATFG